MALYTNHSALAIGPFVEPQTWSSTANKTTDPRLNRLRHLQCELRNLDICAASPSGRHRRNTYFPGKYVIYKLFKTFHIIESNTGVIDLFDTYLKYVIVYMK